jgi:hypothetical protein
MLKRRKKSFLVVKGDGGFLVVWGKGGELISTTPGEIWETGLPGKYI